MLVESLDEAERLRVLPPPRRCGGPWRAALTVCGALLLVAAAVVAWAYSPHRRAG